MTPNQSERIGELANALAAVQRDLRVAIKDKPNPFFKAKYADLQTVVETARPLLVKNGLSVVQLCGGDGRIVTVRTVLLHLSGEWLSDDGLAMVPVKLDPQGIASCITYARRYGYMAIIGIVSDDDDDGEEASGRGERQAVPAIVRSISDSPRRHTVVDVEAVNLLALLAAIRAGGGWNAPSHRDNWRKKYAAQFAALNEEDRAEVQKAFLAITTKGNS